MPSKIITAIPVFNGERFIAHTIESVLKARMDHHRIVVFDNASTDRTLEVLRSFGDDVDVIGRESNAGMVPNLNQCVAQGSSADFLHLLMADDEVAPEFYRQLIAAMVETDADIGFTDHYQMDAKGVRLGTMHCRLSAQVTWQDYVKSMLENDHPYLCSTLYRTRYRPLPYEFEDLKQSDHLFMSMIAHSSRRTIPHLQSALCGQRLHPFSASARNKFDVKAVVVSEFEVAKRMQSLTPSTTKDRFRLVLQHACRAELRRQVLKLDGQSSEELERWVARTFSLPTVVASRLILLMDNTYRRIKKQHTRAESILLNK